MADAGCFRFSCERERERESLRERERETERESFRNRERGSRLSDFSPPLAERRIHNDRICLVGYWQETSCGALLATIRLGYPHTAACARHHSHHQQHRELHHYHQNHHGIPHQPHHRVTQRNAIDELEVGFHSNNRSLWSTDKKGISAVSNLSKKAPYRFTVRYVPARSCHPSSRCAETCTTTSPPSTSGESWRA